VPSVRYGVEALKPATKLRPFWESLDPGDLDDEHYFAETEQIYDPYQSLSSESRPVSAYW